MTPEQTSIDDLGEPLSELTFCVVDLETTGGSAAAGSKITEFGAVKVRGGNVLGEFQTLVNPDESIPAFITVLTGITDQMVINAPRIAEVMPSFIEFARGSVLVAHNAPFDVGFLKYYCRDLGIEWPKFPVLDTVVLARRALLRDEASNVKLATLSRLFGATTTPNHRALSDARATVDVMHGLFERLGSLGVSTLDEVSAYTSKVTPEQRKKRTLAEHLPERPGVYVFRDKDDQPLYIGTSRNLRRRVKSYFTSSETRTRMGQMVMLAQRIEGIVCATTLEAQVRELRLIAHHRPPFNRRSRFPNKASWLKLTNEPWPRLSVVRAIRDDDADYIGPFRGRVDAEQAMAVLHDAFAIRQCTTTLARKSRRSACALVEMGLCLSPCDGSADVVEYQAEVERVRDILRGDPDVLVARTRARMVELAKVEHFEEAAMWRDRLSSLLRGAARTQRLLELTAVPELVAAAPHPEGWEVHVIRFGRLAAAGILPHRVHPNGWVDALLATAETVDAGFGPVPAATAEETECLLRWLGGDGARMVRGSWHSPLAGAARHLAPFDNAHANWSHLSAQG